MKRLALLLFLAATSLQAQSNVAGLLFASNFATWNVPQGNVGQMSWSSPSFCTVTSGGTTFRAFSVGVPITLNDSETPTNTEVITPTVVNYSGFGCSFSAPTTHPHRTFYFTTGTAGLGEALAFAGTAAYQVVVTPDWQRLGGTTAMITSSTVGGTNVPILDQRSSVMVPYLWSGSAYVASPGSGGPPTGAASNCLAGTYPGPGLSSPCVVAGVAGQKISPSDVEAGNTPVLPSPSSPSGGDDYTVLQAAINAGISQNREVYIPVGAWKTSAGLVAASAQFRIRGASGNTTSITATGAGYTLLSIGNGSNSFVGPTGWAKDLNLIGNGRPTGGPTGFSDLQINGLIQFLIDSVTTSQNDIGFDLINNCYGTEIYNVRSDLGGTVNVGLNLRTGSQSGSDIQIYNPWLLGVVAGIEISPNGGNYHIFGGQIGVIPGTYTDTAADVILGLDYLTGAIGATSEQFVANSFEGTNQGWVFRAYGNTYLNTYGLSVDPSNSNGAIGVYKNTSYGTSHTSFRDTTLAGNFNSTTTGQPLVVISGVNTGFNQNTFGINFQEEGTSSAGPLINGTATAVQSMLGQSGLLPYGNVIGMAGVSIPDTNLLSSATLSNNGAGQLQVSPSLGCFSGGLCNQNAVVTTPTASYTQKTCASSATGATSSACTWSTAPVAGETVACGLYSTTSGTFSATDSGSTAYAADGSVHSGSPLSGFSQLFYSAPLAGSITTTTMSTTASGNLVLLCNSAKNIASTSPTDGVCSGDSSNQTTQCGSSFTTTQPNDYVFCAAASNAAISQQGQFFPGSSSGNFLSQYQLQGPLAAVQPYFNTQPSAHSSLLCGAFKSSSTASAPAIDGGNISNIPKLGVQQTWLADQIISTTDQFPLEITSSNGASAGTCEAMYNTGSGGKNWWFCSTGAGLGAGQLAAYDLSDVAVGFELGFSGGVMKFVMPTPSELDVGAIAVGGSQALTSVQGTAGTKLPAASGTFTNGNLRSTNSTGDEVDSGVAASTVASNGSAITPTSVAVNGDSAFTAAPRSFLSASTGSLTAIVANAQYSPSKIVKSGTLENIEGTASSFSCVSNPTLTLEDCGTSAGTCASPTVLASVTLTAANTITDGTISSATLTAGHYIAWETTAGTCTSVGLSGSAEYRMN